MSTQKAPSSASSASRLCRFLDRFLTEDDAYENAEISDAYFRNDSGACADQHEDLRCDVTEEESDAITTNCAALEARPVVSLKYTHYCSDDLLNPMVSSSMHVQDTKMGSDFCEEKSCDPGNLHDPEKLMMLSILKSELDGESGTRASFLSNGIPRLSDFRSYAISAVQATASGMLRLVQESAMTVVAEIAALEHEVEVNTERIETRENLCSYDDQRDALVTVADGVQSMNAISCTKATEMEGRLSCSQGVSPFCNNRCGSDTSKASFLVVGKSSNVVSKTGNLPQHAEIGCHCYALNDGIATGTSLLPVCAQFKVHHNAEEEMISLEDDESDFIFENHVAGYVSVEPVASSPNSLNSTGFVMV
jgi:hypothetical protein